MSKCLHRLLALVSMLLTLLLANIAAAAPSPEYLQKYYTALAASSCLGVYMPQSSTEFSYLRSYGWNIAPKVDRDGRVESNFAIAHNYFPREQKLIFMVTFRGSASKGDWSIDLKTKKVNYGGQKLQEMLELAQAPLVKNGPAIHKGFNVYTENVLKNSVLNADGSLRGVFQVVKERPDAYLIITGHSLGGAAATILGERLIDLGLPKDKFQVITFGAPAVGNEAFAQSYGNRMNLTRIVNPNDPIPGSLQTFFNGYKQFGQVLKYQLPYKVSSIQHAMALYFDESVSQYHKQLDIEIGAGRMKPMPAKRYTEGKPVVAIWFNADATLQKQAYGEAARRFMVAEYKRMLPSYVVMSEGLDLNDKKYKNLQQAAAAVKADYVMICGVEAQTLQDQDYWYLNLTQTVVDKNGSLLGYSGYGKKVGKSMSAVQAAGENLFDGRKDLNQILPFVKLQHPGEDRSF